MNGKRIFALKGNLIYTKEIGTMEIAMQHYLVCEDGKVEGIYAALPEKFREIPVEDFGERLIIPGLTDLHVHAPQYSFRGMSMDLELLEWLETNTFPEESKYQDLEYAEKSYRIFTDHIRRSATTRVCAFATIHNEATLLLMDQLEEAGIAAMVGKVNMDRNSPDYLREASAKEAAEATKTWLRAVAERHYRHVQPILTPRFILSCSDELMEL